jgi:hypothetical protein
MFRYAVFHADVSFQGCKFLGLCLPSFGFLFMDFSIRLIFSKLAIDIPSVADLDNPNG